jgi:electron transfer flavoprotein beta subunit
MTGMNVVVCVKQIPDPASPGALDPSTNYLKRDGKLILDDSDAYGVEMALQLVTAAGGGEVTLVSMAPNSETSGLRTGLAMGAAKAILVSDPPSPARTPSAPPRCSPPPSSGPSPSS